MNEENTNCANCGQQQSAENQTCNICGVNIIQATEIAALKGRITNLEQILVAITERSPSASVIVRERLGGQAVADPVSNTPSPSTSEPIQVSVPAVPEAELEKEPLNVMALAENWLSKIGIVLVILAAVFLFNYAVDQGWLTEPIRVGMGLILGAGLLFWGFRLDESRETLSLVLKGGAIAVFYLTGFAAFTLFELIPFPLAGFFMVVVTALAYYMAVASNDSILANIGIIGGIATPFLLDGGGDNGNVLTLTVYVSVLVLVTCAIFYVKRWAWVYRWCAAGAIGLLLLALDNSRGSAEMWATQIAILICWLGLTVAAIAPYIMAPDEQLYEDRLEERYKFILNSIGLEPNFPYFTAIVLPVFALGATTSMWAETDEEVAVFITIFAILYAIITVILQLRSKQPALVGFFGHFVTVAMIAVAGFVTEFEWTFIAVVAIWIISYIFSRTLDSQVYRHGWLILSGFVGFYTFGLIIDRSTMPIFNLTGVASLLSIGLFAAIAYLSDSQKMRFALGLTAHLLLLTWIGTEVVDADLSTSFVTIGWGVLGAIILTGSLIKNNETAQIVGLMTLLLVLGKLFLVDLSGLSTVVRIALFFGLGMAFLVLSYFYRRLWRPEAEATVVVPEEEVSAPN